MKRIFKLKKMKNKHFLFSNFAAFATGLTLFLGFSFALGEGSADLKGDKVNGESKLLAEEWNALVNQVKAWNRADDGNLKFVQNGGSGKVIIGDKIGKEGILNVGGDAAFKGSASFDVGSSENFTIKNGDTEILKIEDESINFVKPATFVGAITAEEITANAGLTFDKTGGYLQLPTEKTEETNPCNVDKKGAIFFNDNYEICFCNSDGIAKKVVDKTTDCFPS